MVGWLCNMYLRVNRNRHRGKHNGRKWNRTSSIKLHLSIKNHDLLFCLDIRSEVERKRQSTSISIATYVDMLRIFFPFGGLSSGFITQHLQAFVSCSLRDKHDNDAQSFIVPFFCFKTNNDITP
ncbi:CLUMA_CG021474, isoform A [Clunio marinus]|uniref:CLUMA_CG021474, isoform A n=1 Tax=Clunio marinus TaxID=568069 RepID=A0A1J1J7E6_9DIPT|nr:CLUMA_CG021474, isoform A [Clunio marinus]